ncbi:hypothetical protein NBRC110019_16500 [Neptunitalea chrysea]|uniref:Uncharacterized protein n=2 Tax=Neptunitalea chrysea TaxID=1647581 RepID=A0A9W6ETV2_9FLAO|nr:hypothetical protein NBRC110019_16500 [Neptunitalea chrysea]
MAEINMNEVDVYPLFEDCDETSNKQLQKICFEDHLRTLFNDLLAAHKFTVEEDINDTIYLYFVVDNTGKIQYRRTEKNSKLNLLLPNIDSLLEAQTKELPTIYPAQKQGIKVASKCKLPIIINSH